MRRITSPTSCGHRGCWQSQQIESLAFSNPNWHNKQYNNDDNSETTTTTTTTTTTMTRTTTTTTTTSMTTILTAIVNIVTALKMTPTTTTTTTTPTTTTTTTTTSMTTILTTNNDSDSDDDDDKDDDDNSDDDSDNEDSNDDSDEDYDKAASLVGCLRTQKSIVWRLIVVLGPHFQVYYLPITRPDFCVITSLKDCIDLPVVFCQFCLVDQLHKEELTFLRQDCLLEGFCLGL